MRRQLCKTRGCHLLDLTVKLAKLRIEITVRKQVFLKLFTHGLDHVGRKHGSQTFVFPDHCKIPVQVSINTLFKVGKQQIKFLRNIPVNQLPRLLAFDFYITVQLCV